MTKVKTNLQNQISKEDIYIELMERYPGLTLDDIVDMNPHQQLTLYRGKKIATMTPEEYQAFLAKRGRN